MRLALAPGPLRRLAQRRGVVAGGMPVWLWWVCRSGAVDAAWNIKVTSQKTSNASNRYGYTAS